MSFNREFKKEYQSNLERALAQLQEREPSFKEKDGRYFAMDIELTKDEYEKFLIKVSQAAEAISDTVRNEMRKAA